MELILAISMNAQRKQLDRSGKMMRDYPSYCCQHCGECIGWLGRIFQAIGFRLHKCGDKQ